MPKPTPRKDRLAGIRTAVYRFFDVNAELLYIGMTHDLDQRWATHQRTQPWWLDVVRRDFTWHDTRAEAEQIEATATALEKPRYDRRGQRTIGGEVDQRLNIETEKAIEAISDDIGNGTYPLWSLLPSYGALSARYGIPVIGITRALSHLAHHTETLVHSKDQFAISRPNCKPSWDAQQMGILFFLASNALGDASFTLTDLTETTGSTRGTAYQHVKHWEAADRVERLGEVPGGRALIYRIIRHPEPDPPTTLVIWGRADVLAIIQWLNDQLTTDAAVSDDRASQALIERDREIVAACMPDEFGAFSSVVRVLKVMARQYVDRPGCLPEWGITRGAAK